MRRMMAGAKAQLRARSAARTLASAALGAAARDYGPLRGGRTRAERDASAGRRLAAALGSLRGIYTKLGQHLATRVDALSDEFRAPLEALGEAATPVPFASIRKQLARELGGERFSWIDPT